MWVRPFRISIFFLLAMCGLACVPSAVLAQPALPTPENSTAVDYWIASSRECCQRGQTRCPQGTLRYFAADTAGQLSDLTEPTFLAGLRYDVPICFVVHGDLTSFQDVRSAAPSIVKWIRQGAGQQPVQIVFYTWPSDDVINPVPQLSISVRGERAEFNGCYLAQLIDKFPANTQISFFGHSFGARITAATLHLLAGGTIPGCQFQVNPATQRTYRAVFIAGAVDRTWLNPNERYGRALWITEWLLNIHNGADVVINLYPLKSLFGQQALGRVGFSPSDKRRMGPLAAKVFDWDVTMGIGPRHAWAFYYSRPEIATVMAPLLVYSQPPPVTVDPRTVGYRPVPQPRFRNAVQVPAVPPAAKVLQDSTNTPSTSPTRSGL